MLKAVLACLLAGVVSRGVAQQCGGMLRAPTTFASPGSPQPYPSNLHCEWEIVTERGVRILLEFLDQFAVESAPNCTKDAVVIYDWNKDDYTEIERLCGSDKPYWYKSTFNKMKVVLKTDNETNLSGFQAEWTTTCDGNYLATDSEQFIYSPGYPNYWPNMSCVYRIDIPQKRKENSGRADAHKKGRLKFVSFELEEGSQQCSDMCCNDYVTLEYNSKYESYCGIKTITEKYFTDYIDVHFSSNGEIEKKGFVISYSIYECGEKRITEPTTITPNYFNGYPSDINCTWVIEAPRNKKVMVKIAYINFNTGLVCEDTDHVTLYDGLFVHPDRQLASFCGNGNSPVTVPASGNTMTLMFLTVKEGRGFSADVVFSDLELTGCGGLINMTNATSFKLTSPYVSTNNPKDFQTCLWNIVAPEDNVIKVQFISLLLSQCEVESNHNFLEIRDGLMPDSLVLGTYCGRSLPLPVTSSSERLSISLSSVVTSKFTATVTVEKTLCKSTVVQVSKHLTQLKSPGYESRSLPRGINCAFEFQYKSSPIQLTIRNLDIQPSTIPGVCNKDKIIIGQQSGQNSMGKDYSIINRAPFYHSVPVNPFFLNSITPVEKINDFKKLNLTRQYEFCGSHDVLELYLPTSFYLNIITTPETVSQVYKGLEIQVNSPSFCNRNYSEPYGRILNDLSYNKLNDINRGFYKDSDRHDCFTLITAPEGYTISAYFMTFPYVYPRSSDEVHMDIHDGNTTAATKITDKPAFSTGRYLLLHHFRVKQKGIHFDLNYMITNKGPGCGGYLFNDNGMVTSPLYPQYYHSSGNDTCEWDLETPPGTWLRLWVEIGAYGECEQNHVRLLTRGGRLTKTLCGDGDYEYIATENYVKIVTINTMYSVKWRAWFFSISPK